MGGSTGSGKSTFINRENPSEEEFFHIGVSFKLIDCLVNLEDSYLLQIWDLNVKDRFRFLYPTFCLGAKGAMLCFEVCKRESFNELQYWIETLRKKAGNIPIILIGTKNDLSREVSDEDIKELFDKYHLNGIFYTSNNGDDIRKDIFIELIKEVDKTVCVKEFSYQLLQPFLSYDDGDFKNFVDFFSICPMCKEENHFSYLKKFYYSNNSDLVKLKQRLVQLIEAAGDFDALYYNKIIVGIPCCKCFDKYFKGK